MELREALRRVAELMALSARTAPKTAGKDYIVMRIVEGEELARLAEAMIAYGRETGQENFIRDGRSVASSEILLLIGLKDPAKVGLDCGACGSDRCAELVPRQGREFKGGFCAWRLVDLGIAVGSVAKTAGMLNADNRIMYRAGVLARRLGLLEADLLLGIPLSATGKNIFFDR